MLNSSVDAIKAHLQTLSQPELFKAGLDNQHDALMFGLINSENDRRTDLRQGALAQQMGQQGQPPVSQQDLSKMAPSAAPNMPAGMPLQGPGSAAQMMQAPQQGALLPENTGIGALPTKNLTKMAEGGITGFADGGLDSYTPQIFAEAKRLGIDPGIALNLFKTESAGNPNATSGRGAAGLGQLMKPAAQEMGLSDKDRYDPQKNISASLGYFKKQLDRFGSYDKAAAAYNWGPGHVKEHLRQNNGMLDRMSLPKETANYLTKLMPGSQANAAEVVPQAKAPAQPAQAPAQPAQAPAPQSAAAQIPGQTVKAPAAVDSSTYFGGLADRLGIPEEYQRNISNTLNALGGWSSPLSAAGKAAGVASELAPTAEMAAKAEQAKNAVALPRIGYSAGIEGLTPEAQAMRNATVANRQANLLRADQQAATGAQQSVDAATQTARLAGETGQGISDMTNAARLNQAKMTGAAQGLGGMNDVDRAMLGASAAQQATKPPVPDQHIPAPDVGPSTEDIGKNVADTSGKGGRDWNDFLLNLGLGMMAGTSPYALQNIGNAGINALKQEQESKKQALEERKAASLEELQKQQAAYNKANAAYMQDQRGPIGVMGLAQKQMAAWDAQNFGATPEQQQAAHQSIINEAFKNTGIINPGIMTPAQQAALAQYGTR